MADEVEHHRSAIRSMVKRSVESVEGASKKHSFKILTKGPVLSPIKRPMRKESSDEEDRKSPVSETVGRLEQADRRKSNFKPLNVPTLLDIPSELSSEEDKEDDAYDEDLGVTSWVSKEFLYSREVEKAMKKIRVRRDRKRQFNHTDVHIFHLPQIIETGTPRVPFTPSIHRDLPNFQLPEAVSLERTKKAKKKKKHYTEDEFGVYLNTWPPPNLGTDPSLIAGKKKLFKTQDDDSD